MITIPANKLAAVALAVSTEAARYYLQGVFVEASHDKVTMTATNGHILLTAHVETQTPDPFSIIVPAETIALACKSMKGFDIELGRTADQFKLGNISFSPIDGTFPDWRSFVPKAVPAESSVDGIWYSSQYLSVMAKAAKLLGWRTGEGTLGDGFFVYPDAGNPALVQFRDVPDLIGVVLPVRAPKERFTVPAWTKKPHNS